MNFASQIIKNLFSDNTMKKIKEKIPNVSMLKLFSFGNGLIRPGCASFRNNASNGIFHDNGLEELNNLLMNELGYLSMQETIMKFLVQFCGYSDAESDTVRRAIAKKGGTGNLLDEIEKRFIEYTSNKYNVDKEKCAEIIKPFLKAILDASDYGFSWNHSDAYSFIGYAIGYLRYYYPMEFIAAALNIWQNDKEKTSAIISLSNKKKIKISLPKFRYSKSDYMFDKKNKVIYKGLSSIKYLSKNCADEMYKLRDNHYDNFGELLMDLKHTCIDARQLEILIKLEFFSEFGNIKELLNTVNIYEFFKCGESKEIKSEKVSEFEYLEKIVKSNSKLTKSGITYKNLNMKNILLECSNYIKSLNLPDIDVRSKIEWQKEFMGYVSFQSNKESDRYRLIVLDVIPLLTRDKSKIYSYLIKAMSIGTGRSNELKIWTNIYDKEPIQQYDVIQTERTSYYPEFYNGMKSWRLNTYKIDN